MPAAKGTAVHNSLEELLKLDIKSRDAAEVGWLPGVAKQILEGQWEQERDAFHSMPRHPRWKEEELESAHKLLLGSLNLLFSRSGTGKIGLSQVSVEMWRGIQELIIAAEGTLRTSCGRLMGRLDVLMVDLDDKGEARGWLVADLKTGKPPRDDLYDTVSRQLRLYRDILAENNPDHPPIRAEGWYALDSSILVAEGPNTLEDAFDVWEKTKPTPIMLPSTPSADACSFCEWKAWCPDWIWARANGELDVSGIFRDEVVQLVKLEHETGAALLERMAPLDQQGQMAPSGQRFGAVFSGKALVRLQELLDLAWSDPIFLGSVNIGGETWRIGDWCDVIGWQPINATGED
jgi:hypothetical protein